MAFLLTRYVFPIEKKITLSETLNYHLDNPRTLKEEAMIKKFIIASFQKQPSLDDDAYLNKPFIPTVLPLDSLLDDITQYASDFFNMNKDISILDTLSKNWVILRYENKEFEEVAEDGEKLVNMMVYEGNVKVAFEEAFNKATYYAYLLSLLIHNEQKYLGDSIVLLHTAHDLFYGGKAFDILLINVIIGSFYTPNPLKNWLYFPYVKKSLIDAAQQLERLIEIDSQKPGRAQNQKQSSKSDEKAQSPREKLFFIGSLLKTISHDTKSMKVKLLLLVTIIEFILTRNPDHQKFNVEDSISKQFKLKAATLVYLNDKGKDLEEIKKNLGIFYSQRSDVGHGNYISHNKEKSFPDSVTTLYEYIRAIILEYLKDYKLVDFLKEN
ncbi:MAG TPA: hypothetical protein VEX63_07345 [Flavisolibacter sp.]|nr:hypothetical protein [Flavisolibacter sp.]